VKRSRGVPAGRGVDRAVPEDGSPAPDGSSRPSGGKGDLAQTSLGVHSGVEVITTGATQRHARRSTALARRPRRRHRRLDGISRRLHDNAVAESLVANPEKELVHRCAWPTRRKLPPRSSRHRSLLEPHPPFTRRSAASRPSSSRSSQRQELQGSTATARLASPWGRRNGSTPEPARADSVRSCGQHTRQCSASCTSSAKITPAQSERHRVDMRPRSRPPDLERRPPHHLKENASLSARRRSHSLRTRGLRTHASCAGRCRGPLSSPAMSSRCRYISAQ
jgi:hypothetical protein